MTDIGVFVLIGKLIIRSFSAVILVCTICGEGLAQEATSSSESSVVLVEEEIAEENGSNNDRPEIIITERHAEMSNTADGEAPRETETVSSVRAGKAAEPSDKAADPGRISETGGDDKKPRAPASDKLPPRPAVKKKRHSISAGLGITVCGFAEGIIHGAGCIKTSEPFFWADVPIKYHRRVNRRFEWGVGAMPSIIYVVGTGGVVGHLLGELKIYAVPDWIYFRLNVIMGFPLLFALGPAMGHDISVSKKVSIYLENQFTIMVVAGVYGFWQPILGVKIDL